MSGINGLKVTHDPSERLSYYPADAVSKHMLRSGTFFAVAVAA